MLRRNANIDGYLELLNEEGRLMGKIATQVKTIPPSLSGKFVFDCPTSILAFAERTTDPVFIIAVDHDNQIALWKYINRGIILSNAEKSEQQTIRISFDDSEKLSSENVKEVISNWERIISKNIELFDRALTLETENEDLRKGLVNYNNPSLALNTIDIVNIQLFVDCLNDLYENDFRYIKQLFYPNIWKRGIAVFKYSETELSYSIYSIRYGENSLLLKQVSPSEIRNFREFYSWNCRENEIKSHPLKLATKLVKLDVDKFLSNNRVLPLYYEFANEYVLEFVNENHRALKIDRNLLLDIDSFLKHLTDHYGIRTGVNCSVKINNRDYLLNPLYDSLCFLQLIGCNTIQQLYPQKSCSYKTGFVCDLFTPEAARVKILYVFDIIMKTYKSFIDRNFPSLINELNMFYNADLVLIDIHYTGNGGDLFGQEHYICIYYMRSKGVKTGNSDVVFSFNKDSVIYQENKIDNQSDFFYQDCILYNSVEYELFKRESIDLQIVLWNNNSLIDTFYHFFTKEIQ